MIELPSSEWMLQENGEIHVRVQHEQVRPWVVATDVVENGDGSYNAHVHYERNPVPAEDPLDEQPAMLWDEDVHLLPPETETAPEGGTVAIGATDGVGTEDVGPGQA